MCIRKNDDDKKKRKNNEGKGNKIGMHEPENVVHVNGKIAAIPKSVHGAFASLNSPSVHSFLI